MSIATHPQEFTQAPEERHGSVRECSIGQPHVEETRTMSLLTELDAPAMTPCL